MRPNGGGGDSDPASRLRETLGGRPARLRRRLCVHRQFGPAQGADRPGFPAGLADQRLRLLHLHAFARSPEGRRVRREGDAGVGLARGGRHLHREGEGRPAMDRGGDVGSRRAMCPTRPSPPCRPSFSPRKSPTSPSGSASSMSTTACPSASAARWATNRRLSWHRHFVRLWRSGPAPPPDCGPCRRR